MEKSNNISVVQNYIKEYIKSHDLKPGDKLPSEVQLAEELGIARNSVREATRTLESIGVLEIKHGVGLVVRKFNLDAIVNIFSFGFSMNPSLIFELYEIRKHLECSLMGKVIENIDEISISKCELILAQWEYYAKIGKPVHDIDREFHDVLYKTLNNSLLNALYDIFWTAFKEAESSNMIHKFNPTSKEESLEVLADHRAILEAIRNKDAALATKLMSEHFRELSLPD